MNAGDEKLLMVKHFGLRSNLLSVQVILFMITTIKSSVTRLHCRTSHKAVISGHYSLMEETSFTLYFYCISIVFLLYF